MSVEGKIAGLANRMKSLPESSEDTFVFCEYAPDFDNRWIILDSVQRRQFIDKYLRGETLSSEYHSLARIIKVGYSKVIPTFNFDDLPERALEAT